MKKRLLFLFTAVIFCLQLHATVPPLSSDFVNNDYTGNWGKLKLVGVRLSSENGNAIQLKGWSTHGWQFPDVKKNTFAYKSGFEGMKAMGANVVRIAAYSSSYDGVTNNATMNNIISWVKDCMAYTEELNMYCIVDYHVLTPGYPLMYLEEGGLDRDAESFFTQICEEVREKGYKHVIYEICNEPSEKLTITSPTTSISREISWDNIKEYSAKILPIIGAVDPSAVVIVGTPTYDQRLDYAAGAIGSGKLTLPVGYPNLNIMYAFHYYACSHLSQFNTYMKTYADQIPIFATEWSVTKASGTGTCDASTTNSNLFLDFCRDNNISWCSWSWCAKDEVSSALNFSTYYSSNYVYTAEDLTDTGLFIANRLQEGLANSTADIKSIKFGIYPNPAKDGIFNISLEDNTLTSVVVSNVQGKIVYSSVIEGEDIVPVNASLIPGIYIVTLKNNNGVATQKLVVE